MEDRDRERERERELSDLSQSGSGKAGMGTGEEDTPPSHPPSRDRGGIQCGVQVLSDWSDCSDWIIDGDKSLIFNSVSD